MQTRTGLIAAAGLEAINVAGLAETLQHLVSAQWNVAILCHTLSRADRAAIIAVLRRRNPLAPIFLVARRGYTPAEEAAGFDAVLSSVPAKMIATLREFVTQQQSPKEDRLEEAAD